MLASDQQQALHDLSVAANGRQDQQAQMLAGGNQLQQQPTRLLEMLQTYLNGNGADPRKDTLSAGPTYT